GNVTFDVEGAEGGPTPTTGASFNGGHLDFFDIDMNSMIRDFEYGSYTFACWMKPTGSAGGQGFMWGQTNQGIHNGIRNGGLLHSAHWGADWNASTVLENDKWVHAVWAYDGEKDEATIYLNGQVDGGPVAQRSPNGGGTFIFGGRNNGEDSYYGHVDDVTIWRTVLPEGSIQALADGASPIEVNSSSKATVVTNVTGAPSGTSSTSSLNLRDSYLDITNLDLTNEIQNNGDGSFTISKWVNLSDLSDTTNKTLFSIGDDISLILSSDEKLKLSTSFQNGTNLPSTLSEAFNYNDFSDISDLTFVRSASVKNNKLDLNGTNGNTTGAVWTKDKYFVEDGFRITYKFQIGALTGGGSDGIWFYIQNSSGDAISTGGYSNSPQGGTTFNGDYFSVGIDTYRNGWDPNNWHLEWGYRGFGTEQNNLKSTPLPDSKNSNIHTITIEYDAEKKRIFAFYDEVLILEDSFDLKIKFHWIMAMLTLGVLEFVAGLQRVTKY
ncbi:MAG: LamG-like jellyroll fold domain-containing protein, partial [Verrucomicrobiales bacterium]